MWSIFLTAIALLLVFEGLMPFIAPKLWRFMMEHMIRQSDHIIRMIGLSCLISGSVLMVLVHSGILS